MIAFDFDAVHCNTPMGMIMTLETIVLSCVGAGIIMLILDGKLSSEDREKLRQETEYDLSIW
ncbi:hypothetical protein D7I41_04320 [Ochrobactrum sp. MH181795]|nr:hypothetical protein D7I41_04320 [Ochrobactrum sp. MH181795]